MGEQMRLQVGLRTHPGLQRPANEDSLGGPEGVPPDVLARKGWLYVVADGMGGHVAGRMASETAVRTIVEEYYRDPSLSVEESLPAAVERANAAVYAQAQDPAHKGMGSTIVAAVVREDELYVANVGDSRAYLIRGKNITQITRDHSWVEEHRRAGVLTAEEAREHPYGHMITRSLGAASQVQVDMFQHRLHPGDIVLLCSDGLWGAVADGEMQRVAVSREPQQATETLVALANERGGSDNISVVLVRVGRGTPAAAARGLGVLVPLLVAALAIGVWLKVFVPNLTRTLISTPTTAIPVVTSLPILTPTVLTATTTLTEVPTQTSTQAPTATPVPILLPAPTATRALTIAPGTAVEVVAPDGLPLYSFPDTRYTSQKPLQSGTKLLIVGGPHYEYSVFSCQFGVYIWWEVQTDEGERGWVIEGCWAGESYISPIPGQ